MRTLVALIAALVAIPLAAAARPTVPSALSLSVSSYRVLYGHGLTLSGRLTGAHHAGRAVTIDAWPYGASSPHRLAVVVTDVAGSWSLRTKPAIQTGYQAEVATAMSPRVTIGVAPEVSLTRLANGRLRVRVHAAGRFAGKFVQLQSRNRDATWTTVERTRLSSAAIAVIRPVPGTSTLRVAMSVNQAGAGYLGASSHALTVRLVSLTLAPSTLTVLYGHRVTLSGRLVNGRPGEGISITVHPYGRPAFRLATVKAARDGRFSVIASPTILSSYVAHLGAGQVSPRVVVDVRPTITVRPIRNNVVRAHVSSAAFIRGKMVELQRLLAGSRWQTLARQRLSDTSTAVFTLAPSNDVLRVAMSVNQAGAGYVGSTSHTFILKAV